MRILMIVLYAVFILNLSATIINIPADQSSIQAGINIAVDNDTILIQPGTYYENINFNGKNITVTSMFMTTQDTTYISQTVIDGSQPSNPDSSSVVTFCCGEDTTAILCGLTIMNGNAYNGGGIYCYGSNPTFDNLVIVNNTAHRGGGIYISDNEALSCNDVSISGNFAEWSGGGIYFANSITNLNNIIISENSAFMGAGIGCYTDSNVDLENIVFINNNSDNNGGAIYCNNSSINIADSQLTENYAYGWGGGISLSYNSTTSLENVTINNNHALYGGGIHCHESVLSFDAENRCNIYSNNTLENRGFGADIFSNNSGVIEIIVDTFTVLIPTDYYASPLNYYNFDIQSSILDSLVNADLYVSINGDDNNSGLSAEDPLKTISSALSKIFADSLNQNTIHIASGVYSSNTNGERFPISWSSYVSLEGFGTEETIIDANNETRVFEFHFVQEAYLRNITVLNGSQYAGGGVLCISSNPIFEKILLKNNTANRGGGIYCTSSNPILINVTIENNVANTQGGGIYCTDNSIISIINSIVSNNSGSFGIYSDSCSPMIEFSNFWNNEDGNFFGCGDDIGVNVATNTNGDSCDIFYNIQLDPLFVDLQNGDFHLTENSPCIDAGDPNSPLDPDDTIADMGAFYYDQGTGTNENYELQNFTFLLNNHPNPFNPATTIEFSIQNDSKVNLSIYNIKGQKIKTLSQNEYPKGSHSIVWNGDDNLEKSISSGIYYYKLNVNGKTVAVKKCLLLK